MSKKSDYKGFVFHRMFTEEGVSPYDTVKWKKTTAEITDGSGNVFFRQENVEVPENWSDMATKVIVSKYFYGKNGTPERESSVKQLVHRVCRTIADWGVEHGYFDKANADIFYDELAWLCVHQYGAFNSPVWFNVGLFQQYGVGVGSGEGNWAYDWNTGDIKRARTQYERPQCSACFIQSVEDNMDSIMELAKSEAMLFKFGSGTGTDLSTIRSSKEELSGGGKPSGPLSFLKVYDQVANVVKSGGKTRRAAKMNTLFDWHGDIKEFIEVKSKEEKKVQALINEGYDPSFNGEAYGSAMYQNENLSVRVTDEFMQAAIDDKPWYTKAVTDGRVLEELSAKELLYGVAKGTWECGDPGLQYDGAIQKWHTCKASGKIMSSNPCSEYLFLNDSACNLASLNLMRFINDKGDFDLDWFCEAVHYFIIAQEIIVDCASYPTKKIAKNSHKYRALGLGFANIGALLMSYGLPYDSEDGRGIAGCIAAIMTGQAYATSAQCAGILGPFEGYKQNEESMKEVIALHTKCAEELKVPDKFKYLKESAVNTWSAVDTYSSNGFRNAQVTVLAPTGTISFMMDCDTTGVEPDIALVKYKFLVGGGMLKMTNRIVPMALKALGYKKDAIEKILAHIQQWDTIEDVVEDGKVYQSGLNPDHLAVFDCAFKALKGKRSITPMGHLRMMAACQPFISGAISKTVNMPHDCTVEDIMQTYIQAWKIGLKCVAIYRDGSKCSQPLRTSGDDDNPATNAEIEALKKENEALSKEVDALREKADAPVRHRLKPVRKAITHKFEIAGHEGYMTVGLYENGEPGELFVTMSKEGSTIRGLIDVIATLTSISLQYGVPLEDLVHKFEYQRFEPSGFTGNPEIHTASSIIDYIYRWMGKRFLEPKTQETVTANEKIAPAKVNEFNEAISHFQKDAPICPNCGHITVRNGACYKCLNCGDSLGCS